MSTAWVPWAYLVCILLGALFLGGQIAEFIQRWRNKR